MSSLRGNKPFAIKEQIGVLARNHFAVYRRQVFETGGKMTQTTAPTITFEELEIPLQR